MSSIGARDIAQTCSPHSPDKAGPATSNSSCNSPPLSPRRGPSSNFAGGRSPCCVTQPSRSPKFRDVLHGIVNSRISKSSGTRPLPPRGKSGWPPFRPGASDDSHHGRDDSEISSDTVEPTAALAPLNTPTQGRAGKAATTECSRGNFHKRSPYLFDAPVSPAVAIGMSASSLSCQRAPTIATRPSSCPPTQEAPPRTKVKDNPRLQDRAVTAKTASLETGFPMGCFSKSRAEFTLIPNPLHGLVPWDEVRHPMGNPSPISDPTFGISFVSSNSLKSDTVSMVNPKSPKKAVRLPKELPTKTPRPRDKGLQSSQTGPLARNVDDIMELDGRYITVTEARACKHKFLPGPAFYGHPKCPTCRMTSWLSERRKKKSEIIAMGVFPFKERANELLDFGDPRGKTRHKKVTEQISSSREIIKKENTKKRSRDQTGTDFEYSSTWNGLKAQIMNMLSQLEDIKAYELMFDRSTLIALLDNKEKMDTTAQKAMEIYGSEDEGNMYLDGDPVSPTYRHWNGSVENSKERTIVGEPPARRRKIFSDVKVSWNEKVKVSATHVVLGPDSDKDTTLPDFTMGKIIGEPSTLPLQPLASELVKPPRNCGHFMRAHVKFKDRGKKVVLEKSAERTKNKYYNPGVWHSPEEYEKAETSWTGFTWDEMEIDVHPLAGSTSGMAKTVPHEQEKGNATLFQRCMYPLLAIF